MKKSKKKMTRETKIGILKFFIFIFIILCIFSAFVFFQGKRGRRLKRVTIEIQTEKLNNSIKIFKALEGKYPELAGKENNLRPEKGPAKIIAWRVHFSGQSRDEFANKSPR